jgi:Spy/CpxP family protein refolding chaperone
MKRFAVILLAQFVVIAAAAFFGSWAFSRWQGDGEKPAGDEMWWFRSQLGLSAEQAGKLETIHEQFLAEQSRLCETHCAKRFELGELIQQSQSMTGQVEQLARELAEIEARSQRLTIEHIFQVGKQLTAAQRTKFVGKVYDQICTSCPMGSHRPATGKRAACDGCDCGCGVASIPGEAQAAGPLAVLPPPSPRIEISPAAMPVGFPLMDRSALLAAFFPGSPAAASVSRHLVFRVFLI